MMCDSQYAYPWASRRQAFATPSVGTTVFRGTYDDIFPFGVGFGRRSDLLLLQTMTILRWSMLSKGRLTLILGNRATTCSLWKCPPDQRLRRSSSWLYSDTTIVTGRRYFGRRIIGDHRDRPQIVRVRDLGARPQARNLHRLWGRSVEAQPHALTIKLDVLEEGVDEHNAVREAEDLSPGRRERVDAPVIGPRLLSFVYVRQSRQAAPVAAQNNLAVRGLRSGHAQSLRSPVALSDVAKPKAIGPITAISGDGARQLRPRADFFSP